MKLTQDLAGKHMENLRKFFQVFQGAKSLVAGQFAYFSRLSRSDYWGPIFKGSIYSKSLLVGFTVAVGHRTVAILLAMTFR